MSQVKSDAAVDKDWWRGAVIYQIYPRSYQDSTGDGVGDLNGITQRLSYIASLGVDAIWISPFFTSPMKDFGYDVSNYCDIDPMFGSLADFDKLVETAHGLGLKIIIDQVLSHSSDQHPWFVESRASTNNPKSDWYVWADPKPDGTPPNNWLSIFGGSGWQWDGRREQYYLHNFLTTQPDLNLHNLDVQNALLDTVRFWLDRGVDGFRLDTINFYFADKELRDNPPLPMEERNSSIAPSDEYPGATSVGEVGDAQFGLDLMGEYTQGDDRIHMCYTFEFLSAELLDAKRVESVFKQLDESAPDGWPCWALTNHDIQRHTTRWNLNEDSRRLYLLLMMCLRGSACLYQGEELGLPEADIQFDELQDPYGIEFWPEFKGRDGCRTPMVWEQGKNHGGFSDAKPWLPVPSEHLALSVDVQEPDSNSLLNYYRQAITFRKSHPVLGKGSQVDMKANGPVLSFTREHDNAKLFCAFNLSDKETSIEVPEGSWVLVGDQLNACNQKNGQRAVLAPFQALIAQSQ